jgi:hypothetical protein
MRQYAAQGNCRRAAWGKPPDYDPREERPELAIDTSMLSSEERRFLRSILRKGVVKEVDPMSHPRSGPATIEAEPA